MTTTDPTAEAPVPADPVGTQPDAAESQPPADDSDPDVSDDDQATPDAGPAGADGAATPAERRKAAKAAAKAVKAAKAAKAPKAAIAAPAEVQAPPADPAPDAPEPEAIAMPAELPRFKVLETARFVIAGHVSSLSAGTVIDPLNYDIDAVRAQGVRLVPCSASDIPTTPAIGHQVM